MESIVYNLLSRIDFTIATLFVTALAGGYIRDYIRIVDSGVLEKISLGNVLVATVASTIVSYGMSDYVISNFGEKSLIIVSFMGGVIGFQVLENISSADSILDILIYLKTGRKWNTKKNYDEVNDHGIRPKDPNRNRKAK